MGYKLINSTTKKVCDESEEEIFDYCGINLVHEYEFDSPVDALTYLVESPDRMIRLTNKCMFEVMNTFDKGFDIVGFCYSWTGKIFKVLGPFCTFGGNFSDLDSVGVSVRYRGKVDDNGLVTLDDDCELNDILNR